MKRAPMLVGNLVKRRHGRRTTTPVILDGTGRHPLHRAPPGRGGARHRRPLANLLPPGALSARLRNDRPGRPRRPPAKKPTMHQSTSGCSTSDSRPSPRLRHGALRARPARLSARRPITLHRARRRWCPGGQRSIFPTPGWRRWCCHAPGSTTARHRSRQPNRAIDSDCQGQIFVSVWNRGRPFIEPWGIARLVVVPVLQVGFKLRRGFEQTRAGRTASAAGESTDARRGFQPASHVLCRRRPRAADAPCRNSFFDGLFSLPGDVEPGGPVRQRRGAVARDRAGGRGGRWPGWASSIAARTPTIDFFPRRRSTSPGEPPSSSRTSAITLARNNTPRPARAHGRLHCAAYVTQRRI